MAGFPSEEAEIVALAKRLAKGLESAVDVYPQPPVPPADLRSSAEAFVRLREKEIAAKRNLEAVVREREEGLEALIEKTKIDVAYAERQVNYDDAKLRDLGWKGRKPQRLQPPGMARSLELVRIFSDEGVVELDWKKPCEGGEAQSYRIEGRIKGTERWSLKGFSLHSDCKLTTLEAGHEWEVRVIAVNRNGESAPCDPILVES